MTSYCLMGRVSVSRNENGSEIGGGDGVYRIMNAFNNTELYT